MADKHPYVSTIGGLSKAITQFRSTFPATVNANTLKSLGIAPNNESYVINTFRFLGFIDDDDKKTDAAGTVFSHHDDEKFSEAFAARVEKTYSGLFDLHGDQSWILDNDKLISFFRNTDQTSAIVGKRQANTFRALAQLAGYGDPPDVKTKGSSTKLIKKKSPKQKVPTPRSDQNNVPNESHDATPRNSSRVGLTVRIEINLPAEGDQDTYDRIFKSIRENLLGE